MGHQYQHGYLFIIISCLLAAGAQVRGHVVVV